MAENLLIDSPSPPPLLEMRHHQSAFTAAAGENGGCGEIVEVQGGHIVRSTGRKDRHRKVCTAKGPRDRRVRLSAPTAIQFYDVQDRLGFDRPSKAVDWLIKKAKSAIDDLEKLPPWNPVDTLHHAKLRKTKTLISSASTGEETEHHHHHHHHHHHNERQMGEEGSFLPATMDSDSIADTIKSFFPVSIGACASTQQNYYPQPSSNIQSQDLRLSLQSFQNGPPFANQTEHALFSSQSNLLGFNSSTASWDHQSQQNHQSPEFGKIQKPVTWNNSGAAQGGGGGGFVFASPSSFQPAISQSHHLSQRGSLQSINTPMIRAWFDPHHQSITTDELHHHHHPYHIPSRIHQSAIPGVAFASNGEFSGFSIPALFQGEQEEHGDNNKLSSASSDSHH